jgi:dTDP-4-dehydrorhamnose reductase
LQNKNSLAEWALNSFKHGKQVTGFNNVFFNPVYTVQLADMILRLVQIKYKGIINVGSDAIITKYSFLVELAKTFGFNQEIVLEASLDETKFKAKRPLNTTLNLDILRDVIGDAPKMTDGLKLFYNNFTKKKNTCL